ncbi:hypothetical protein NIES4101_53360 [Calothrix sp. NIES-4101]|nr:hypothetical protein NIES4101_53360 [Calothrix sp. NIES-4101]
MKFKRKDWVYHPKTGEVVQIVSCVRATATPVKIEISIVGNKNRSIKGTVSKRGEQTYLYQLEGTGTVFPEEVLKSATPCPNCQTNGWDWETGCEVCSLSPEDIE